MGEAVLGPLVGIGTTAKVRERKTVRKETGRGVVITREDGNKTPYGGTVDGGKINQGQELSRIAVGNEISHCFPFLSRDHAVVFSMMPVLQSEN